MLESQDNAFASECNLKLFELQNTYLEARALNALRWTACSASSEWPAMVLGGRPAVPSGAAAMNDQYTGFETRICNVCAIASCRKYIHSPGICKRVNTFRAICRRARGTHACHTHATKLEHNKWVPPSISRTDMSANADALSKVITITNAQKLCDEAGFGKSEEVFRTCHVTTLGRHRNIMWLRISLSPDKILSKTCPRLQTELRKLRQAQKLHTRSHWSALMCSMSTQANP